VQSIAAAVRRYVAAGLPPVHRSERFEIYRKRTAALDTSSQFDPLTLRDCWNGKTAIGGAQ